MNFLINLRHPVMAATLALAMTACASFAEHKVANVTDMPSVSQYAHKPSVYLDVKFFHGDPDSAKAVDVTANVPQAKDIVSKISKESKLFSEYTFDPFKKNDTDYTIQLHIYNHGSAGAASVMGFISGFTFGVIPAAATDNYTLKAQVMANDGKSPVAMRNDGAIKTWIGIWFIPAMGNTPAKAFDEVLGNMVKDAYKKMVDQKELRYSQNLFLAPNQG